MALMTRPDSLSAIASLKRLKCYELCRTTAHSRREITLFFAALAERGSRARFVRWLTDRLGRPTHYKPVQLQYSGGLTHNFLQMEE
jgi:hypothetical protein